MKSGIQVVKDRTKSIVDNIRKVKFVDVLVGIPAEKAQRQAGGMTNAVLGYLHENGVPELNIPRRAFLMPGIRDEQAKIASYLKQATQASMRGDKAGMERALNAAGLTGMKGAQHKITKGPFIPLAASTLRRRRARGRTGTRPLIDTGQLRRALTYIVRNRSTGSSGVTEYAITKGAK